MISDIFTEISSKYLIEKQNPMKDNKFAQYVRDAKNILQGSIKKNKNHYECNSSPGRPPNWADVPWLAVYDPNVTSTSQRGYYVTYLFSIDMKRAYITMNQGMTDLQNQLKTKAAINELKRRADLIRDKLPEYKNFFEYKPIDLSINLAGSTKRPMLYEQGHSFGKEYNLNNNINENELVEDLNNMLDLYKKLFFRGGTNTNSDYDESIDEQEKKETNDILTETYKRKLHQSLERPNSSNARKIKNILGYTCEVCGFNFRKKYGDISLNKNEEEFIEAHHKIPVHSLPENEVIEFKIEDFAVLCSNCHRMAHKRKEPYTIEELKKFLKESETK